MWEEAERKGEWGSGTACPTAVAGRIEDVSTFFVTSTWTTEVVSSFGVSSRPAAGLNNYVGRRSVGTVPE